MAEGQEYSGSVKRQLAKLFEVSLKATVLDEPDVEPLITACNPSFGDYQCNNAMSLWTKIKNKGTEFRGPQPLGRAIMQNLPASDMIESCTIAGPGFVNIVLSRQWITQFGMLIEFLFDKFPNWEVVTDQAIVLKKDLNMICVAPRYADLKNNISTNYTFNFDQMLNGKGNTVVYLLYAHARICSIIRKSTADIDELKKEGQIELAHPDERILGLHLLQFPEIVEEACTNLLPNVLGEYLYNLSEDFTRFYSNCQVVGSAEQTSRLLLCEGTAILMRKSFHLLGITPVYKI